MNFNDTLTVTIESVAFGGDGVARVEGAVIFVPGGLEGERVSITIIEAKKNFFRGRITEILTPSPERVAPPCPYYGACGGCQYMHMRYDAQVRCKTQQIKDALRRIGGCVVENVAAAASEHPLNYRNKIKLNIGRAGGEIVLGFVGNNNIEIVPVGACLIAHDDINAHIATARQELAAWKGPLPESVTIRRSSQGTVSHFFDAPHRMAGRPRTVMERIGQKLFEIPAESFFQVNSEMMAALLGHASSLVAEGSVIVDSYCGAGVIGLAALRPGQSLIGIDSDKASIACAVNNVRITGAEQAEFIARTAESALGDVLKSQAGKPVTLILDPPRDGCAPAVLKAIGKSRPETIVYISCNPPTLARDVKSLLGAYTLTETVFVDMFPQTKHSEVIVRLIRK